MAEKEGPNESIELAFADYVKLKVPGVITKALFGSRAATADTLKTLGLSAAAKTASGVPLHPDEQIAHDLLMAPLRKKAARLLNTGIRAAEIVANEPKLLPGHVEGQPTPEPQPPSEAWSERFAEGASLDADQSVREMWARILAGQVTKPGSFSFKTLSVLKDVEPFFAEAFVRLLSFSLNDEGVPNWKQLVSAYDRHDLPYPRFLAFEELGLLNFSTESSLATELLPHQDLTFAIPGRTKPIEIHALTHAGHELASICDRAPNLDAARAIGEWLATAHGNVTVNVPGAPEFRPWSKEGIALTPDGGSFRFA